jgi:hypothetical protein
LDAYSNVTNQATQVASTPYAPYSGNTVAGLSPDQTSAIGEVEGAQGIANPYINAAAGYINNSTTPLWSGVQQFSPSAVSQYESPYTQQVLQTTQAAENNQDAQQQAGIVGNAVSQGAFGGDRSAVAQGITAGQQAIANNQTNAGIENQGYTQALGEFNQQQTSQLGANQANAWLNSQAGYGMSNLGNEALSSTLTGANALMSAGSTEQSMAQEELNVPYQQYLAQQAYPFQTTGWLANISEGLGGASGGSSSTTSPGASVASQLTGLGIAGAGLYGSGALGAMGSGIGSLFAASTPAAGTAAAEAAGIGASGLIDTAMAGTVDTALAEAAPAALASDRRVKADIEKVGHLNDGQDVYRYRYKGDPQWHIGLMAQEVEKHHPEAVHDMGGGIMGVNYHDATESAVRRNAGGGIVVPFPHQHRGSGRGIVANDDFFPEPERARASGGGVSVQPGAYAGSPGVPMLGTSGGTGSGITGSASVPMLPVPSGSHAGSTSTNSDLSSYLTSVMAGASSAPPPKVTIKPYDPTPQQQIEEAFGGGDGGGGGGMQRGGGIVHRADGGPTVDLGGAGSSGLDDEPAITGAPPTIDIPDMGSGPGRKAPAGGGSHVPRLGPSILAGPLPAAMGGSGDDTGSGAASPGKPSGKSSGIVQGGDAPSSDAPSSDDGHTSGLGLDPWLTLTAVGLGIMGGTSHQAGVNIGRGALEGLQFGEQQAQRQESSDLRRTQQEENDLYRQGVLADKSRGRDIQLDRANTYAMVSQASASQKMAAAALESARAAAGAAGHATEGDILSGAVSSLTGQPNPDNDGKPFSRAEALMHIKGVDSLAAHRQAQDDQGWARVDNQSDTNDIRRQAFSETVKQHGIGNDLAAQKQVETRIKDMSGDAARIYLGSKNPITGAFALTPDQAEAQAQKFRAGGGQQSGGTQQPAVGGTQQPAASAPQFQEGKTYVDGSGNKATYQNGQWVPVQ